MNKEQNKQIDEIIARLESLKQTDKPKFEVGKVYKDPKNKYMYMITKLGVMYFNAYGFSSDGVWYDGDQSQWFSDGCIPAATEEWKQALIAESKRLGLIGGVTVKELSASDIKKLTNGQHLYNSVSDALYFGGALIYQQGQWAEVVEEKIMIGKWDVEFKEGLAFINNTCYNVFHHSVTLLKNYPKFKILIEGEELTLDVCQKIINRLSK